MLVEHRPIDKDEAMVRGIVVGVSTGRRKRNSQLSGNELIGVPTACPRGSGLLGVFLRSRSARRQDPDPAQIHRQLDADILRPALIPQHASSRLRGPTPLLVHLSPNGLVGVSPIFGSTWAFRTIDPIRAEPNARLPDLKSPRAGSGIG